METQLAALQESSRREKSYDELKPVLDQIKSRLMEERKSELMTFKDQLKLLLEKEIASRYYLERGAVEVSFKNDDDLKKAMDELNNPSSYRKTLGLD